MRIQQGVGVGQHVRWLVMVRDNGVNTQRTGQGDFLDRGDATIDGDEQTHATTG